MMGLATSSFHYGEVLNEVGDIVSDVAIFYPLLFLEGLDFRYQWEPAEYVDNPAMFWTRHTQVN